MHKEFQISRLALIMNDPTRMAEVMFSVCNVLVPSMALMIGRSEFPVPASDLLSEIYLTDNLIGIGGVVLALCQLWGAGTDWYLARSYIATAICCCLITVVTAYLFTGYVFRPTFPLLVGTILGEMFIAWRTRHEKPAPVEHAPMEKAIHGLPRNR